jgi:hypothetical protein
MLPGQTAENSPVNVVAVWLVTRHWRFEHDETLGSALSDCEAHVPRYDCDELGVPPPLTFPDGAVGAGVLLACSNPQAVASTQAAAAAIQRVIVFFMMISSLIL